MGSLRIGRAFGINIFLHWTFWLLPAFVVLSSATRTGGLDLLLSLAVLAAAFGCVVLHELGHALAARYFGIGTRDITLYPIGGVARLERMSDKPWEEFWIALAGPAVNVVIAALLAVLLVAVAAVNPALVFDTFAGMLLLSLMVVNIFLVLFNLLPAFPMDGGRVLRALLALGLGQVRATRVAVVVGLVMAVLIGLVGTLWLQNPMLLVIAFFIYVVGQQELQMVYYREYQRRMEAMNLGPTREPSGALASPAFTLQPRITVYRWDEPTGRWVKEPSDQPGRAL
jgi:Zn-dependent protease